MYSFTALERSALEEICRRLPAEGEILESQLATATVVRRENSGTGFFTHLTIDRATAPVPSSERVVGEVTASIKGFEQPLILLLFMKDGYADFLEGATINDSTMGLDLTTLQFEIDLA